MENAFNFMERMCKIKAQDIFFLFPSVSLDLDQ